LKTDSVAQLVEQYTFNVWVLGSNPSGITPMKPQLKINWGFFYLMSLTDKTHVWRDPAGIAKGMHGIEAHARVDMRGGWRV
jgi:hypothetical protein